jgi:hypothetical protein
MTSNAATPQEYLNELEGDRKEALTQLFEVITKNLPEGFEPAMGYGMMGFVVPHSIYPSGYHCNPKDPLPFMGMASQKNHISVYHMGMYTQPELLDWFTSEFKSLKGKKPDMGKSCIRFKKTADIPMELIGELASKMTVQQWIETYEKNLKK